MLRSTKLISVLLVLFAVNAASADLVYLGDSAEKNDNPNKQNELDAIRDVINANLSFFIPSTPISSGDLVQLDKTDSVGPFGTLMMTGSTSGQYSYTPSGSEIMQIITTKSSNTVQVFAVRPDCQSGDWAHQNGLTNGLSHATAWAITGASVAVPEPSAFLLCGLVAIGVYTRRFFSAK